jgi:hypothetical protein
LNIVGLVGVFPDIGVLDVDWISNHFGGGGDYANLKDLKLIIWMRLLS